MTTTLNKIEPATFEAPACWASYFINGDASGLENGERNAADKFLQENGFPCPVSCGEQEFIGLHDGLQCSMLEYTSLINS